MHTTIENFVATAQRMQGDIDNILDNVKAAAIERNKSDDYLLQRVNRRLARARRIDADKHDRRVMLKIKLKNLADEARLIRREESLRKGGWLRLELRGHRKGLATEARATAIAYGLLRGTPLERIESGHTPKDVDAFVAGKVLVMLKKYGAKDWPIPGWVASRA